jgi:hypothetical protein
MGIREKLINSLSDSLRAEYEWLQKEMDNVRRVSVIGQYKIGQRVRKLRDKKTEGDDRPCLDVLAAALDIDKAVLYGLAHLAEVYSQEDIQKKLQLRCRNGSSLSINHFLELSTIEDTKKRERAEQLVLENNLSHAALQLEIRANLVGTRQSNNRSGRPTIGPRSPGAAVVALNKTCAKITKDAEIYLDQLTLLETSPLEYQGLPFYQEIPDLLRNLEEVQQFVNSCRSHLKTLVDGTGKSATKAATAKAPAAKGSAAKASPAKKASKSGAKSRAAAK